MESGNATITGTLDVSQTVSANKAEIDSLTLKNGSITDSGNQISFGTNNLVTTGTLNTGNATVGVLNTGNVVTTGTNTVSSNLNVSGSSLLSNVTVNNGQITSSTGTLGFSDNNVKTTGTLESGNLTVTGNIAASGSLTTDRC